jgi:hypothetical protein
MVDPMMPRRDELCERIERVAASMGIAAVCKIVRYPAFESDAGERFDAYDEYEVRSADRFVSINLHGSSPDSLTDNAIGSFVSHLSTTTIQ